MGNRFASYPLCIAQTANRCTFLGKLVVFLQESGKIACRFAFSPVWLTMASDHAVLHSRSATLPDSVPCTESVQEVYELTELLRLVDGLPIVYRPEFYKILDRLASCLERRQRMLGYVQDSLNQMSLDLKYLIFDLEATRRERDEYRSLLESPF